MESNYAYETGSLFYTIEGNGPTVVLLHGFGEEGSIFNEQVLALQKDFTVVVPHLPGSGSSPFDPKTSKSIDTMAELIAGFIKTTLQQPVVLLGHSMGGYFTLAVAEKYPQLLKGFGLLHSTAFADSEEKKETRRKAIEFIAKNGSHAFLKTAIPGLFCDGFREHHSPDVDALIEKGKAFEPEVLIAYYEAMIARPDRTHVIKSSIAPVLFIIGEEDKAAPLPDVMQQVSLAATSYVHVLHHTAHMGMLEETTLFNLYLAKYLKAITGNC